MTTPFQFTPLSIFIILAVLLLPGGLLLSPLLMRRKKGNAMTQPPAREEGAVSLGSATSRPLRRLRAISAPMR